MQQQAVSFVQRIDAARVVSVVIVDVLTVIENLSFSVSVPSSPYGVSSIAVAHTSVTIVQLCINIVETALRHGDVSLSVLHSTLKKG